MATTKMGMNISFMWERCEISWLRVDCSRLYFSRMVTTTSPIPHSLIIGLPYCFHKMIRPIISTIESGRGCHDGRNEPCITSKTRS